MCCHGKWPAALIIMCYVMVSHHREVSCDDHVISVAMAALRDKGIHQLLWDAAFRHH